MIKTFKDKILPAKKIFLLFLLLLAVSLGVRCYRPKALTIFLDDQARDVLTAAQILKEGRIPFIGPMASIGNLYLGPFFYWLITPFLWLANFDPVGPILLVAFLGWLANIILFFLLEKYFNLRSAFIGAFLYALSPLIIHNSRFIWNPNPVPLFTLIFLWFFLEFWEKGRPKSFFWLGVSLGVLIQLHYVTGVLFLVCLAGYLVWVFKNRDKDWVNLLKPAAFLILGIVLPLIPFILFEFKNHFINTQAGWRFIFGPSSNQERLFSPSQAFFGLWSRLSKEALVVDWAWAYFILSFLAFLGLLIRKIPVRTKRLIWVVSLTFLFGLLATVLIIKGQIHLHYLGLLMPLFFIIIAGADYFWQKSRIFNRPILALVNFLAILLILFPMIREDHKFLFKQGDNQQINRAREISFWIADQSEDKNIFVTSLSGSPYAYTYRYYLYLAGFVTDSLQPSSVFAICEGGNCGDPEGHALWEIAQFGVLKTVQAKQVGYGVWVYELKPAQ
ncbi:MAG: transmembrane(s)proteins 7..25 [Microgenomates bacterium 39_6]|nr:MAG: transmembrane(s)proteins 7..25 [Microgenomates bacterium 39_6]